MGQEIVVTSDLEVLFYKICRVTELLGRSQDDITRRRLEKQFHFLCEQFTEEVITSWRNGNGLIL